MKFRDDDSGHDLFDDEWFRRHIESENRRDEPDFVEMGVPTLVYAVPCVVLLCIALACCCRRRRAAGQIISPPPPAPPGPNVNAPYPQQQYTPYPVPVVTTYPVSAATNATYPTTYPAAVPYPAAGAPFPAGAPYPTVAPYPTAGGPYSSAPSAPDPNALPPSYEQVMGAPPGSGGLLSPGAGGPCDKQAAYNPHAPH